MTILCPLLFGYSPSNFHSLSEGNQFMYILMWVGRFSPRWETIRRSFFTAVMPLNLPTHHRGHWYVKPRLFIILWSLHLLVLFKAYFFADRDNSFHTKVAFCKMSRARTWYRPLNPRWVFTWCEIYTAYKTYTNFKNVIYIKNI